MALALAGCGGGGGGGTDTEGSAGSSDSVDVTLGEATDTEATDTGATDLDTGSQATDATVPDTGAGDDGDTSAHVSVASGSRNGVPLDEREGITPPAPASTDLAAAAKAAHCDLMENLPDEGNTHLPPGSPTPNYKTNPPTSGNHVEPPFQQADGSYSVEPVIIDFVHSLEHGRIELQYSPDLPEADQLLLKGLFDQQYAGSLLFPDKEMPYAVAATSWQNLIGCKKFEGAKTVDALRAFGAKHFGKAPEIPFGILPGPTPAQPNLG